ncbi:MAG TPA: hypothetical protein VMV24_01130 [Candidatus Dormibacteraeota bacterium]|nr:hypothetical protein [Candidatus Dormibacteraeota bacterium]
MENPQIISPDISNKNSSDTDSFNVPVSTSSTTTTPTVSDFTSSSVGSSSSSFGPLSSSDDSNSPVVDPVTSSTPNPIPGLDMNRSATEKSEPLVQPKSKLSAPIKSQNYSAKGPKALTTILGVIIVLLIIGGIYGVYSWQHKKVTQADSANATLNYQISNLQSQLSTANKNLATAQAALNNSTIDISALSVSLVVPPTLKDLTVATNATPAKLTVNGASVTPVEVNLSSTSLTTLDSACSAAQGALGKLSKTAGQYPTTPTATNSSGTLVEQFSSYYLAYSAPSACSKVASTNTTQMSLVNDLKSTLVKANITVN